MIKVALLIPTLDRSGAEKQFQLLATGLPRDEFDVHVIALTRGGPYEQPIRDAGIPLTILNKRFRFDPIAFVRLRRLLARLKPDIVHSWLFAGSAYARLVGGADRKFVVSERCVDSWKSGWQLSLDRKLISRTHRLVGNSNAVADFYRDLGYPNDRVSVIPNGITLPDVQSDDRDSAFAEFDIPAGARVVGFVGRLAPQKRVTELVFAMQMLRQFTDNVYFLIVGDGPERERCMEHAIKYDCQHLIRFAGHRSDASKLIGHLDVFWLASDFEGMSNSVMEAMAAGVPVVATNIAANQELIVDGETGFLVNVGDSVAFYQFTDRILTDSELTARLSHAARQRMANEFSVQRMIDAYAATYRGDEADVSETVA